jgi:hypothetical protein
MMKYLFIIPAIMWAFCDFANAKDMPPSRVYLLGKPQQPVVIKSKKVDGGVLQVMRDPNLDSVKSAVPVKKAMAPTPPKQVVKKTSKSVVGFKPVKIAGTLRLPRVQFGRLNIESSLREPTVDTNFIGKSLSELP